MSEQKNNKTYNSADAAGGFTLAVFSAIVVSFAALLLLMLGGLIFAKDAKKGTALLDGSFYLYLGVMVLMQGGNVLVFYYINRKKRRSAACRGDAASSTPCRSERGEESSAAVPTAKFDFRKASYLRKIDPPVNYLFTVAIALAALFGFMGVSFLFDRFFGVIGYKQPETPFSSNDPNVIIFNDAGKIVAALIGAALVPAICEELIFRGVVLRGLGADYRAVLVSAALFSLFHMSPAQTAHQFLIGIVLGALALETGSLLAPMIMHFLNNALAVTLEPAGLFGAMDALPAGTLIWVSCVTFIAGIGIIALCLFAIRRIKGRREKGEAEGRREKGEGRSADGIAECHSERTVATGSEESPAAKSAAPPRRLFADSRAVMLLALGVIAALIMWVSGLITGLK